MSLDWKIFLPAKKDFRATMAAFESFIPRGRQPILHAPEFAGIATSTGIATCLGYTSPHQMGAVSPRKRTQRTLRMLQRSTALTRRRQPDAGRASVVSTGNRREPPVTCCASVSPLLRRMCRRLRL
jgi:hypothetical protein